MHALLPTDIKQQPTAVEGSRFHYVWSPVIATTKPLASVAVRNNAARQFVILLIENDTSFAAEFTRAVSEHGFDVEHHASVSDVRRALQVTDARMVAIGSVSQSPDNFSICRDVRQASPGIPIIWLQADDDEFDQALMIELGADVCMSRSANLRVMLAQVKSLRRRLETDHAANSHADGQSPLITHGRLQVSPASFQIYVDGRPIALATGLFTTLMRLVNRADEVIPRKDLVQAGQSVFSRSVDTTVNRLRNCLRQAGLPLGVIRSARGTGYIFVSAQCNSEP